jgi:hypothetical protein
MLRQIITPSEPSFTLNLPAEMVGKTVEVIAFEIDDITSRQQLSKEEKIKSIQSITNQSLIDLSKFKFNRDDANNYDE